MFACFLVLRFFSCIAKPTSALSKVRWHPVVCVCRSDVGEPAARLSVCGSRCLARQHAGQPLGAVEEDTQQEVSEWGMQIKICRQCWLLHVQHFGFSPSFASLHTTKQTLTPDKANSATKLLVQDLILIYYQDSITSLKLFTPDLTILMCLS